MTTKHRTEAVLGAQILLFVLKVCIIASLVPVGLTAQGGGQSRTLIAKPSVQAIGLDVQYFRDPSRRLGVQEMTHGEFAAQFNRLTVNYPNFGYVHDALWFRIRLQNTLPVRVERVLDVGSVLLDSVALYEPEVSGNFHEAWAGNAIFIEQRSMKVHRTAFTLVLNSYEEKIYYVRCVGEVPMIFHLTLYPQNEFAQLERDDGTFYGCLWGIILCIILYHLVLFFITRSRLYFYFALHGAASLMALLSISDIPTTYLWFNVDDFSNRILQVSVSISNLLSVRYAQIFLESYRRPVINNILRGEFTIALVLIVLAVFGWSTFMVASLYTLVVVPTILVLTVMMIRQSEGAIRVAFWLYAAAWGLCTITVVAANIAGTMLDLGEFWVVKMGSLCAAAQMFVVAAALAVRAGHRQREFARAQIERALAEEDRAREHRRNAELSEANEAIRHQAQQLEEQALSLTSANHEMEQIAQELIQQRILLQQKNDALNAASAEKSEILSIAAHDLKNPLTGLKGMIEILRSGDDFKPGYLHRMSSTMQQSVDRMFDIVRNLLDLHALEEGAIQPVMEAFDMVSAVKSIVDAYRLPAAHKRIAVELKANAPEVPCFTDHQHFVQVTDNLVSNAVKYSPPDKHVMVRTILLEQSPHLAEELASYQLYDLALLQQLSDTKHIALLIVQDQGPGLTDSDKERLFQKFARLSAQPTGGEHSTGLGLSITKRLVESMHGVIWCESTASEGARFVVAFGTSIA